MPLWSLEPDLRVKVPFGPKLIEVGHLFSSTVSRFFLLGMLVQNQKRKPTFPLYEHFGQEEDRIAHLKVLPMPISSECID